MVGLGGLETTDLALISIEVPGLGVSFFAIPDAVRLHNPKLMLWRELRQRGEEALQKSNKRWLVLGLRPKDHDSRMGFWRVSLDIREIQVQRHQHAIFRAATLGEHRIAGTR